MASSTGPSRSSASAIQVKAVPSSRPAEASACAIACSRNALPAAYCATPSSRKASASWANHAGGSPRQAGACRPAKTSTRCASPASSGRCWVQNSSAAGSSSPSTRQLAVPPSPRHRPRCATETAPHGVRPWWAPDAPAPESAPVPFAAMSRHRAQRLPSALRAQSLRRAHLTARLERRNGSV